MARLSAVLHRWSFKALSAWRWLQPASPAGYSVISDMEYKEFYRRNLPHLQSFNAAYFVTTRLKGTLPQEAISKLLGLKKELEKANDPKAGSRLFKYLDDCLDNGFGVKWLEEPRIQAIVREELMRVPENAHMHCFCIMPNHIHLLMSVNDGPKSLERIMRSIKGRSARFSNQILGRTGAFWQRESFDHQLRQNEWERVIFYIANNPVKAGLVKHWQDWPGTYVEEKLLYLLPGRGLPAKASATK